MVAHLVERVWTGHWEVVSLIEGTPNKSSHLDIPEGTSFGGVRRSSLCIRRTVGFCGFTGLGRKIWSALPLL